MDPILAPAGLQALAASMRPRSLVCFDFDGTLAPIVADPADAFVSPELQGLLEQLARRRPVAIISGREADDVRARLGFQPLAVVGNHGADGWEPRGTAQACWAACMAKVDHSREFLERAGVTLELKSRSIALHVRRAQSPTHAYAAIERCLANLPAESISVFAGKCVVNVIARAAPDKADAVVRLLGETGCNHGVYAGDDVNDEPVFQRGIDGLLTVRVGYSGSSAARYFVTAQEDIADLVRCLLAASAGL